MTTISEFEDRVYPGVYNTPPTIKPNSGLPCAEGDRCVIIVGGNSYEHLFLSGGWVIPNIDATQLASSEVKAGEGSVSPQDFWLPTDPDWTNAFELWAAAGGNCIPDGTYVLTRQITINGARSIHVGDVTLDFSQAIDASGFPDSACFYVNAGALTQIPNLSADVAKGGNTLSFAAAPALQRGDVLIIYNPTDFSWSGHRAYYRAGEFVEIDSFTGSTARVFGTLYDNYAAAAVQVYMLPRAPFDFSGGRPKFIGSTAVGFEAVATTKFSNCPALGLNKLTAGGSLYASAATERCFNIYGTGLDISQAKDVATGTDYGLVIGNSQKVRLTGKFAGGRIAVATGGDDSIGCVPCRDGVVSGSFSNSAAAGAGIGAVNNHGNTEYWRFEGVLDGGYSGGGNHNGVTPGSMLISRNTQNGIAIYLGEMVGCDFTFAGVSISARGNPSAGGTFGVIDVGGSSAAMDANTKFGGVLDFSDVSLDAPDATRGMVIVNRGCTAVEPILVKTSGMVVQRLSASPVLAFSVGAPIGGGKAFDVADMRGMVVPMATYASGSPYSISAAGVAKLRGWTRSGTATGVASTSAATLAIPVVYDQPAPAVPPKPTLTLDRGRTGSQTFLAIVSANSTAGFTITVLTADGTNFASAFSFPVSWSATVEQ